MTETAEYVEPKTDEAVIDEADEFVDAANEAVKQGKVEQLDNGGIRYKSDVVTATMLPNGTIYGATADKSFQAVVYGDGSNKASAITKDGYLDVDGTQWKRLPDGSYANQKGEKLTSVTMTDDGTIIEGNTNGTTTHIKTDRSSAIVAADGRGSISMDKDGNVTEANMGDTSWKFENGKWTERNNSNGAATGRTTDKAPTMDKDGNITVDLGDKATETYTPGAKVSADKNGKVTEVKYNDGSSRQFGYDPLSGELTTVKERDGHVWTNHEGTWMSDDGTSRSDADVIVLRNGTMMVSTPNGKSWEVRTTDAPGAKKVLDK